MIWDGVVLDNKMLVQIVGGLAGGLVSVVTFLFTLGNTGSTTTSGSVGGE